MKLKEFIKNLSQRKKRVQSTDIASQNDFVILPTREDLNKDPLKIAMLDNYKKAYSKILSSKHIITSRDLELENYYEDINMYIELLLNLIGTDDQVITDFSKVNYYSDGTKKIEYMSKMSKLKTYLYNIEQIRMQTTLRIISLIEILKEKFFLSPQKKNSIKEEISNLKGSLLVIENQRFAISIEVKKYLTDYGMLMPSELVEDDIDQKIIQEKCQELRSILTVLCPDTLKKLEVQKDNIVNLTLMEKTLEEYIYKHKKEAQELSKEIANLLSSMKKNVELNNIEPRINEVELKLKAFSIYGHNLITKEDISNLYTIKFAVLTRNMMTIPNFNLAENAIHIEVEQYINIISQKISAILMGQNNIFNKIFLDNFSDSLQIFSNYLKAEDGTFDFWNILNTQELLGLVVSFDKTDGIKEYFANIKVPKTEFPQVDFHENKYKHYSEIRTRTKDFPYLQTETKTTEESFFEFADILSLETIFEMAIFNECELTHPLYKLFETIFNKNQNEEKRFYLPEGLIKINFPKSALLEKDEAIVAKIKKLAKDKLFTTPSTLKEINGPLLRGANVAGIILNEGLQKLRNEVFSKINSITLSIPESITKIDETTFKEALVNRIYFNNLSNTPQSRKNVINVILHFFTATKNGKPQCHYVSDYVKEKQRAYHEGRYSTFCDADLFDRDSIYQKYLLNLASNTRIYMQENGTIVFTFKREDFALTSTRFMSFRWYDRTPVEFRDEEVNITYEEADKIYNHMQELIEKHKKKPLILTKKKDI